MNNKLACLIPITYKIKQVKDSLFVPATDQVHLNEEPCF